MAAEHSSRRSLRQHRLHKHVHTCRMQRYASTPRRDGLCRHRWGARTGHRCVYSRALRVCIHRVPLEGLEPLEPLLNIANVELSWHLVLLVADTDDPARAHAFDFRPRDASSPANLARLMTLGSTQVRPRRAARRAAWHAAAMHPEVIFAFMQGLTRSRPLNGVPSIRTSVLGDVRADLCALGLDGTGESCCAGTARVWGPSLDWSLIQPAPAFSIVTIIVTLHPCAG